MSNEFLRKLTAARRAAWRKDSESTIRFEATFYRNALQKEERREIARRERVPAQLVGIDCLDELELVELLIARIKAEFEGQSKVEAMLKKSTVRLRREKQLKIDLAVLREERKWLSKERNELLARGYEKNTKFAELRAKIKAGEIKVTDEPVRTRKKAKKEKKRKPTFAEQIRVFASKEEVAAYIEQRKSGAWHPDRRVSIGYVKTIYREGLYKWERKWLAPKGVPLMLVTYETLNDQQKWKLRVCRAAKLIERERAEYPKRVRDGKRRCVINLRALQMEIVWLRHMRDEADPNAPSFVSAWNEQQKEKRRAKRKRIAERRAERKARGFAERHAKYASEAERKAAQSAANRRYRERKALAAGKPMPRHYRKYATKEERYQAILASNRESARRRKARERRRGMRDEGWGMRKNVSVNGFSMPCRPPRGPMIVEVKYASYWGRDVG